MSSLTEFDEEITNEFRYCYELDHWDSSFKEFHENGSHPRFGIAMLFPIIISTLFTLYTWWNIETDHKLTLPLVILQCWPQYRAGKILYLGLWKQVNEWKKEQELYKKAIGNIGKKQIFLFLEFSVIS